MPILLKRRNGEITPFRNADFIPAFYFIPKSILNKCGSELNSIPRNPRKLLQNRDAIAMVESDLFLLAIIDAYAYMVWPFVGLGTKRKIYSGYEPSWIQEQGILSPLIVRPKENTADEYEIVSGHRRFRAAVKAGIKEVPALIVPLDRDKAAIAVVDSNLHREHIIKLEESFRTS